MIRISLGKVGSGKTAMEVRNIILNPNKRVTYSNILIKKCKHAKLLKPEYIIKKEVVNIKTNKSTGELKNVYEHKLNIEYWKNINETIDVTLDEAHSILNARRSMSSTNVIVSDWMALIRRVLTGSGNAKGEGTLTLISQLHNRIDSIARDMANQVCYHIAHYIKTCSKCDYSWRENTEVPESIWRCPRCDQGYIKKHSINIEIYYFNSMTAYEEWNESGIPTYYKRQLVKDIEKYFPYYSTLQWDNMFSEFY